MFAEAYGDVAAAHPRCPGVADRPADRGSRNAGGGPERYGLNRRLPPTNRETQYGAVSASTRTTPAVLGAWTNSVDETAMPTCDGPGAMVEKKTRSPGESNPASTDWPSRYCSRTV